MKEEKTGCINDLFDCTGKIAFVNAGTGYLGPAICEVLAASGATVVCTSRSKERAASVADNLPGKGHEGLAMDQMDSESIEKAVCRVVETHGHIDILVNNGYSPGGGLIDDVTPEQFDHDVRNSTGYFLLSRIVRNQAVERGIPASIVMIASMYGMVSSNPEVYEKAGGGNPPAYQIMKAGIIQLTRNLAVYWAKDNIRVNCISPGPFNKPQAKPEMVAEVKKKVPLKRSGVPNELKGAVILLASNAGSYMTGTNIVVDGGWTAW